MRLIDADETKKFVRTLSGKDLLEPDEITELIDIQPTVDAAPAVHAHWELDPNGMDFGLPAWKCSNCGSKNDMIPPFIPTEHGGYVPKNPNVFAGSNYCPNCGAKMDEVESE